MTRSIEMAITIVHGKAGLLYARSWQKLRDFVMGSIGAEGGGTWDPPAGSLDIQGDTVVTMRWIGRGRRYGRMWSDVPSDSTRARIRGLGLMRSVVQSAGKYRFIGLSRWPSNSVRDRMDARTEAEREETIEYYAKNTFSLKEPRRLPGSRFPDGRRVGTESKRSSLAWRRGAGDELVIRFAVFNIATSLSRAGRQSTGLLPCAWTGGEHIAWKTIWQTIAEWGRAHRQSERLFPISAPIG